MVILLVDGDAEARAARAALLEAQGHEVIQAGTAVDAVEHAQTAETLDLLITEASGVAEAFNVFDMAVLSHDAVTTRMAGRHRP